MRKWKHARWLPAALAAAIAVMPVAPVLAQTGGSQQPGPTRPQAPGSGSEAPDGRLTVAVSGTAQPTDVSGAGQQDLTGTFTIQRFARQGNGVVAIGTLVASFEEPEPGADPDPETDVPESPTAAPISAAAEAAPARTIVSRVALPVVETDASGNLQTAQAACQNLRLQLGPRDVALPGAAIEVAPVVLDISAPQVAGTRLGNELCSAGGLVGGGQADQLVAVLNRLLELLG